MSTEAKFARSAISADKSQWHTWLFALLAFLLIFAPIFRGGNRPLATLIIQVTALGLMAVLLWHPQHLRELPLSIRWLAVLSLLWIGISLIPIPSSLWLTISGRELYATALQLVAGDNDSWRTLSILPMQTEAAWFRMLTVISVFMAVYCLPVIQVQRLVYLVLVVAGCEAVLGLMQYGAGANSVLRFGATYYRDAIGTYANRDHLAGFLAMVNPVVLGLLAAQIGVDRVVPGKQQRRSTRSRDFLTSLRGQRAIFIALLSILLLLGVVFSRSRAGIGLSMLGLFVAALVFAWRLGGSNAYGSIGSILAILVVLAAEVGLMPVLDRFSEDPMQDARLTMYSTSLDGIGHFFPFGSGAGTFPYVYPAFQPVILGNHFINHAHNDYLEAVFEQGMAAVVLICVALLLYAKRWRKIRARQDKWGVFRFIQIGAGIGVLVLLLHSLVDFNLQIPANAIFFAFFAAVFFKDYQEIESKRKNRHRSSSSLEIDIQDEPSTTVETALKPKPVGVERKWEDFGEAENPFKDNLLP